MSYCFVFGQQRTGSTLLLDLLGNHKDIATVPNDFALSKIFLNYVISREDKAKLNKWNVKPILNLADSLSNLGEKLGAINVIRLFLDTHFNNKDESVRVYKAPKEEFYIDRYNKAFPYSKHVFTIRNPLAIMASRKYWKSSNNGKWISLHADSISLNSLQSALDYIRANFNTFLSSVKIIDSLLDSSNIMLCIYEDLVTLPHLVMQSIADFIEVEYNDNLIKPKNKPYTSYKKLANKKGIYEDSLNRWSYTLTDIEKGLIYNTFVEFLDNYYFNSRELGNLFSRYYRDVHNVIFKEELKAEDEIVKFKQEENNEDKNIQGRKKNSKGADSSSRSSEEGTG